jgi:glucan phosphoethanolaminetransferase (alkaline phosphatase superfamily)
MPKIRLNLIPVLGPILFATLIIFASLIGLESNGLKPIYLTYVNNLEPLFLLPLGLVLLGHSYITWTCSSLIFLLKKEKTTSSYSSSFLYSLPLILSCLISFAFMAYYNYFGSFPGVSAFEQLILSPEIVAGYLKSGLSLKKFIYGILLLILSSLVIIILIKKIITEVALAKDVILSLVIGSSLIFSGIRTLYSNDSFGFFQLANAHSLPVLYIYTSAYNYIFNSKKNDPSLLLSYIPPPVQALSKIKNSEKKLDSPIHIVVVIAETLRSDKFPFYGYDRKTTPNMEKNYKDWITFNNYRSTAPMSAYSIKSTLSSDYVILPEHETQISANIEKTWASFAEHKINFGIFSGADLSWHRLEEIMHLNKVKEKFSYNSASEEEKKDYSLKDRNDNSLNDKIVFSKTSDFIIKNQSLNTSSFSFLYTMNTHFPYYSDKEDMIYGDIDGTQRNKKEEIVSSHQLGKLADIYDNSIINFDKNIQVFIENLKLQNCHKNTIIIIIGDHGEAFGEHNSLFHGTHLYDEQIKTPLFIWVDDNFNDIKFSLKNSAHKLTSNVDIMPTVFDLFNIKKLSASKGFSLLSSYEKTYEVSTWFKTGKKVTFYNKEKKLIYDIESRQTYKFKFPDDKKELYNLSSDQNNNNLEEFIEYLKKENLINRNL